MKEKYVRCKHCGCVVPVSAVTASTRGKNKKAVVAREVSSPKVSENLDRKVKKLAMRIFGEALGDYDDTFDHEFNSFWPESEKETILEDIDADEVDLDEIEIDFTYSSIDHGRFTIDVPSEHEHLLKEITEAVRNRYNGLVYFDNDGYSGADEHFLISTHNSDAAYDDLETLGVDNVKFKVTSKASPARYSGNHAEFDYQLSFSDFTYDKD